MERNELIELVTRAQQGDNVAFDELFKKTANDFNYFALKLVRDEHIAEDILQDAYVDMFLGIASLKEPAAFIKWAKKIIYHKSTAHFTKRTEVLIEEDEEGHSLFDDIAEDNAEFIPEEALDKDELKNIIRNIINTLPEEQASAAMMFYFDEMSIKDIAEVQGVNENTVKSRLTYARKAIKAAVEDYEKKNGIKLHSALLLPLFLSVFSGEKIGSALSSDGLSSVMAKGAKKLSDRTRSERFKEAAQEAAEEIASTVGDTLKRDGETAGKVVSESVTAPKVASAVTKTGLPVAAKVGLGILAGAAALTVGLVSVLIPLSADKEEDDQKNPPSSVVSGSESEKDETTEEATAEQTVAGKLIPEGGIYYKHVSIIHDDVIVGDGKTVRFPEEIGSSDAYEYGDYYYSAERAEDGSIGWGAYIKEDFKDKTEYASPLSMINGAPLISMQNAFANCENMVVAPAIPESVTNMLGCFQQCYSLKTAPVIPKNVLNTAYCFSGCTSLEGTVVIHANPTETNNMWQGTEHTIYITGDSDMLEDLTVSGLLGIFGDVHLLEEKEEENTEQP